MSARPPDKMNHWHEALLNLMIANPEMKLGEMAAILNKTPAWVSVVKNSDLFQELYRERCKELGQIAMHGIAERLRGLADLAIEKAEEKLQQPVEKVQEAFIVQTMAGVLDRIGFGRGEKVGQVQNVQNNVILVDEDLLARARARAAEVHAKPLNLSAAPMLVEAE